MAPPPIHPPRSRGAPKGRLFLLDQTAERVPIWQKFNNFSFDGAPFAWLSMNNMGGNVGLQGALAWVADGVAGALASSGGALAAVGMDPEGINTMPAYWEYVLQQAFSPPPPPPAAFLPAYGVQRCGAEGAGTRAAWAALGATVYAPSQPNVEHHLHYCGTAMPLPSVGNGWNTPLLRPAFPAAPLAAAWEALLAAAPRCPGAAQLYDLVDVGREFLQLFPCVAGHDALLAAASDAAVDGAAAALRGVLGDLDALLGTTAGFLLGAWLEDARAVGAAANASAAELALLQWNARSQVTTWFPAPPTPDNHLYDYANKLWSGLAKGYYLPRYELLVARTKEALRAGRAVNKTAYAEDLGALGEAWTRGAAAFPAAPVGDALVLSQQLYARYAAGK